MSLASDSSDGPYRDRLYLAFADGRSGRSNVLLTSSADMGRTWSEPVTVNDDPLPLEGRLGPDHAMPMVRVSSRGVVGVTWHDRRNSPDNIGYEVRFAASFDGGETFVSSVRVSEQPHTLAHERWSLSRMVSGGGHPDARFRTRPFLSLGGNIEAMWTGHTAGLAATPDGAFHALWVDNRTGISQVWSAKISVAGSAILHGSKDLAVLRDVSGQVTLHLADSEFIRSGTPMVKTTVHIVNTSESATEGPFKLRAVTLRSDFGRLVPVNADNRVEGLGAMWDLSATVVGGVLKPGEQGRGRRLEFLVEDLRGIDASKTDYYRALQAFDIRARLYAGPSGSESGGKK